MSDTVLYAGNTALGRQDRDSCPHEALSPEGKAAIKCIITKCDVFNINARNFNPTTCCFNDPKLFGGSILQDLIDKSNSSKHCYFFIFFCCWFFWGFFFLATLPVMWDRPGIKSMPSAVEAQRPNHWITREFPNHCYF